MHKFLDMLCLQRWKVLTEVVSHRDVVIIFYISGQLLQAYQRKSV